MSSLQPWNNIPKVYNSKTIRYNNTDSIEFKSNTTYLQEVWEEATEMFA